MYICVSLLLQLHLNAHMYAVCIAVVCLGFTGYVTAAFPTNRSTAEAEAGKEKPISVREDFHLRKNCQNSTGNNTPIDIMNGA